MALEDHLLTADRLLHGIDPADLDIGDRIALALAHAQAAQAYESRTRALIALLLHADQLPPEARDLILALIRRRTGILPPPTSDGTLPNGGA